VILGAGYDTKSIRFQDAKVRYFELDHPSTQKRKTKILNARKDLKFGKNTCFVPCNLSDDSITGQLFTNQFDKSIPTVVIAEGVLSYLTKDRVCSLIEEISMLSDRTVLIFDYRHPVTDVSSIARKWYGEFESKGEQYLGQFTSKEMEKLLLSNHFTIESHDDLYAIAKSYLPEFETNDLKGVSCVIVASRENNRALLK
jgi:methyltransferase (TIGR00027 family)